MKLQSLSNFALNNKQMDATKGGKRDPLAPVAPTPTSRTATVAPGNVRTTGAMLAMVTTAAAKPVSSTSRTAVATCTVTRTTMLTGGKCKEGICIEW